MYVVRQLAPRIELSASTVLRSDLLKDGIAQLGTYVGHKTRPVHTISFVVGAAGKDSHLSGRAWRKNPLENEPLT